MNDGPQGFRTSDAQSGTSTGWPSALTLAATFDTQLASEWGHAMGQEFRDKGAGMQLGPGVNVARLPECGRNFECPAPFYRPAPAACDLIITRRYLSGEDPFLGTPHPRPRPPRRNNIFDRGYGPTAAQDG